MKRELAIGILITVFLVTLVYFIWYFSIETSDGSSYSMCGMEYEDTSYSSTAQPIENRR